MASTHLKDAAAQHTTPTEAAAQPTAPTEAAAPLSNGLLCAHLLMLVGGTCVSWAQPIRCRAREPAGAVPQAV